MAGIYDEQILGAKQQAETARKLREGIKSPEGQMVSGWYVPPSFTQYMAEALKGYYAGKEGAAAKNKYDTLSKKKSDETARYLKEIQPQANTSLTDAGMNQFTQPQDFSLQAAINNGSNPKPQTMATQTTYTQPDEQTRMAALSRGLAVNPDVFAGPAQMGMYDINRQDKQANLKAEQEANRIKMQFEGANKPFLPSGQPNIPYQDYAIRNSKAGAARTNIMAPQKLFENEGKLRDDYRSEPAVKSASEMQNAFNVIETASKNPSPANDLAMATKYMKVLDPTSVVRESEFALAVNATGILDKLYNYANMIKTGQRLNPVQREDFYVSAKAINDAFQAEKNKVGESYKGLATSYGFDPAKVIFQAGAPAGSPNIDALLQKYGH